MKNKTGLIIGGGLLLLVGIMLSMRLRKTRKQSSIPNEETDRLAKEFTSELINSAKSEIVTLESGLDTKKKTAITSGMTERDKVLAMANTDFINEKERSSKLSKINFLKTVVANESNILNGFRKSIPNFNNVNEAIIAKNIFIKMSILDDMSKITPQEMSFLNNPVFNNSLSNTMGFDMPFIAEYYIKRQAKTAI